MWTDPDAGKSDEQRLRSAWLQLNPHEQAEIQQLADAKGSDVLTVMRDLSEQFLEQYANDPAYRAKAIAWLTRRRHPCGQDVEG